MENNSHEMSSYFSLKNTKINVICCSFDLISTLRVNIYTTFALGIDSTFFFFQSKSIDIFSYHIFITIFGMITYLPFVYEIMCVPYPGYNVSGYRCGYL